MIKNIIKVMSKNGLHARQASRLVQECNKYQSEIILEYQGREASAKSILAVTALGVPGGERIVVRADGNDELEALQTVSNLLTSGFNTDSAKAESKKTEHLVYK